jgi:hypothetical protein
MSGYLVISTLAVMIFVLFNIYIMKRFILISIFIFSNWLVFAQGEIYQKGNSNDFCAAVLTEKFKFFHAEQEYDNWCWAACIQMVLNYQGINVDQKAIVTKAYGGLVNKPANCDVMTNAANGWSYEGTEIEAWQVSEVSSKDLIAALANKYPVIIGLNMPGQDVGHAYVLTGIWFRYDQNKKKVPYEVVLRDPWPPNPDKTTIPWSDFKSRINCIVHVTY